MKQVIHKLTREYLMVNIRETGAKYPMYIKSNKYLGKNGA